jgi:hypothetical protein
MTFVGQGSSPACPTTPSRGLASTSSLSTAIAGVAEAERNGRLRRSARCHPFAFVRHAEISAEFGLASATLRTYMRVQIRSRDSGSSSGPKLTPNRFGSTNGLPRWRAARSRRRSLGSSAEFARAARGTGDLLPPFATINEWSSRSQRDVPTSGSCAMSVRRPTT